MQRRKRCVGFRMLIVSSASRIRSTFNIDSMCSNLVQVFAGKDPWAAVGNGEHDPERRIRHRLSEHRLFDGADDVPRKIWALVTDCCVFDNTRRPDLAVSVRNRLRTNLEKYEFPVHDAPPHPRPPAVIPDAEWEIECAAIRHYCPDLTASIDARNIPTAFGGFSDIYKGIWKDRATEAGGPGTVRHCRVRAFSSRFSS